MAKFVPADFVESLDFDFTQYSGREGTITEPTTGTVNKFFKNMKNLMKEVNALQRVAGAVDEDKELTDEEVAAQVAVMDEAESAASQYQTRMIENLAELCGAKRVTDDEGIVTVVGGSPSVADLELLPYRVLQAFSTWLMEQIKPKRTTPGSKP